MGQTQTKIIIITPHSYCVNLPYRHCDARATEEATKIIKILENKGINFDYYKADRFRYYIDYNRKCSRTYKLRRDIEKKIKYYKGVGHNVIILEIHSFPLGYDAYDIRDRPIAFLTTPHYAQKTNEIVKKINEQLDFPVLQFTGTKTNDIQLTTEKYGITHYLIEFNESKEKLTTEQSDNFHKIFTSILLKDYF